MSALAVFECPVCPDTGSQIRSALIDGEPWFVARDLCRALGLGNASQAVSRLDGDGVISNEVIDRLGRAQRVRMVDEAAMYELILQSRKPDARAFTRWVTRDVLPQIRRTGGYVVLGRSSWSGLRDVEPGASLPWSQAEAVARANGLPLAHGTLRDLLTGAGVLTLTGHPHRAFEWLFRPMPSGTRTEVWARCLQAVLHLADQEVQRRRALAGLVQPELPGLEKSDGPLLALVEESA